MHLPFTGTSDPLCLISHCHVLFKCYEAFTAHIITFTCSGSCNQCICKWIRMGLMLTIDRCWWCTNCRGCRGCILWYFQIGWSTLSSWPLWLSRWPYNLLCSFPWPFFCFLWPFFSFLWPFFSFLWPFFSFLWPFFSFPFSDFISFFFFSKSFFLFPSFSFFSFLLLHITFHILLNLSVPLQQLLLYL